MLAFELGHDYWGRDRHEERAFQKTVSKDQILEEKIISRRDTVAICLSLYPRWLAFPFANWTSVSLCSIGPEH